MNTPQQSQSLISWLPCLVFICTAGLLWLAPWSAEVKTHATPAIDPQDLSTEPLRTPLGNPPLTVINGFERDCQDCHKLFTNGQEHNDGKLQHNHIKLAHGLNDNCLNCHFDSNRNKLRLHGNKSITFDKSEMLCAQCHGTTWRDWKNGSHGRVQGSWQEYAEERNRLTCVACHDPHQPAFPGIKPLPGPQTLRMGKPHQHQHHYESSLMDWLNPETEQEHDHD